jgi:hypothetical protein
MSHAIFTATVVDLDEGSHGELAAKFIVDAENKKRAAADPPINPLPVTPWADLKASYLTVLGHTLDRAHENYIKQQADQQASQDELNARWLEGGESERAAALAQLPAVPEAEAHDEETP